MGFIGICIDFFAWPLIALGYPMLASIIAIESGSKLHMRELVIYWTLFSLISLTEFAFVTIIVWIPYWSTIKLIAIFWLVRPRFDGACDAYERLIRPFLCVDLQEVTDRFYSPREENELHRSEIFLDMAEQFIKENGPEALEKLIASKVNKTYIDSHMEGTITSTGSKHDSKEPDNSQRDIQVLEPEEKNAVAKKEKDAAARVNKTTAMEPTTTTNPPEIPPLRKEWMCDLCKVKMRSEQALNEHFQGKKHKSKCESLKASKLPATGKSMQDKIGEAKGKVGQESQQESTKEKQDAAARVNKVTTAEPTTTTNPPEIPPLRKEWMCDLCKVKVTSEQTLNEHFQGRQHKSKIKSLKASKLPATGKSMQDNIGETKGKVGQGSQQESTKKKQDATSTQQSELWCDVCGVKLRSDIDMASHLKGKRHSANIRKMGKL